MRLGTLGGRVRSETQVRLIDNSQISCPSKVLNKHKETHLDGLISREQLLSLLTALDGRMNDNLLSGLPVDGGGDSVLVTELEGIDNSEDFGKVSTGGSGVGKGQSDLLGRVD
jgi:hypothetical protein